MRPHLNLNGSLPSLVQVRSFQTFWRCCGKFPIRGFQSRRASSQQCAPSHAPPHASWIVANHRARALIDSRRVCTRYQDSYFINNTLRSVSPACWKPYGDYIVDGGEMKSKSMALCAECAADENSRNRTWLATDLIISLSLAAAWRRFVHSSTRNVHKRFY